MLNQIDLSRTDLNLLMLFEVVLQERHVGRAAERLKLSPSAVSHGLGRLRRLLNDPLFLRTPKGVVPTERAADLAAPVADVLARVRSVIATAEPFDPATSVRSFVIGAPDGVSAVLLPQLLTVLNDRAPGIDIRLRQLLPVAGETSPERAWRFALTELEARSMDVAIVPAAGIPPRFHQRALYDEDFVLCARVGHPIADEPTLARYCNMRHLVVSHTGDAQGIVDHALAEQGRARRIVLTVPNFMFALAVISDTDLISALPRRFVAMHGARFGVVGIELPIPLRRFHLTAIASKAAMMDKGVAWLVDVLGGAGHAGTAQAQRRISRKRR